LIAAIITGLETGKLILRTNTRATSTAVDLVFFMRDLQVLKNPLDMYLISIRLRFLESETARRSSSSYLNTIAGVSGSSIVSSTKGYRYIFLGWNFLKTPILLAMRKYYQ
jgi:hypothetical protein